MKKILIIKKNYNNNFTFQKSIKKYTIKRKNFIFIKFINCIIFLLSIICYKNK